jgi:hypothetical protein
VVGEKDRVDPVKCMDCDLEIKDQNEHWADCEEAPAYVLYQAKADRRYNAGGPFAPGGHTFECGKDPINRIDRGMPPKECYPDPKKPCKGVA